MDVVVANLGSSSPSGDVYISLWRLELKAGVSQTIGDVSLADLDGDAQLKGLVSAGKISINVTQDTYDAVQGTTGSMNFHGLPKYTVANLPTGYDGRLAFATNGRKVGEGGGSGTGVPVYFDGASWRVFATDAAVAT